MNISYIGTGVSSVDTTGGSAVGGSVDELKSKWIYRRVSDMYTI